MYFRITPNELGNFFKNFYGGMYSNQRLGQAFINQFMPTYDIPNPGELHDLNKLFYCESTEEAMGIIVNSYVRWEDLGK